MNSDYKLIYRRSAVKFIAKLDKTSQERIVTGLKGLLSLPPEGRIGSYRVIFTIVPEE
ncbi:type II toxin-antitoxin system RelE family toxin [Rossellomorea vietnamensis]|uniref:type II toxin-antitoxin system RelE family toxin n=1 Tax=Rossellomorea vietnamensis TaxID=218284 RepID=UPI001C021854|nr:hypothetical protein [Rossellomorea vietnamensis]